MVVAGKVIYNLIFDARVWTHKPRRIRPEFPITVFNLSTMEDDDDDVPIDLKLVLAEILRIMLTCAAGCTLAPLVMAFATHWAVTDDDTFFPWPIDGTVWLVGAIRTIPVLIAIFVYWTAVKAVECSYVWLICFGWILLPWWTLCWVVVHCWRALLWLAFLLPIVPVFVAWANKLVWFVGTFWATGVWQSDHVFTEEYSDRFLASAEHLGTAKYLTSYEAYRSVGMWPDAQHWFMGASYLTIYMAWTLLLLTALLPPYFIFQCAIRRARQRQRVVLKKQD